MHNLQSGYRFLLCGEGRNLLVVVGFCAGDGQENKGNNGGDRVFFPQSARLQHPEG